jgi:uncharacterized protein (TIGR03118 family)
MNLKTTRLLQTVTPLSLLLLALPTTPANAQSFKQTNLVSDIPGLAAHTDSDLVNPWGIAESGGSPFWIANNGTGKATLYNTAGVKQGLVVNTAADPSGQVFNSSAASFAGSHFIFDTEGGVIASWASGTNTVVQVDNSGAGAVYKGLAIDNVNHNLFAANFGENSIDVFNSTFAATSLTGNFTDPNAVAGYAPFNVQNLNGSLYVTYAKQSGGTDEVDGAGFGYVDKYDTQGNFLARIATGTDVGGTLSDLNAPWGLAIAPSTFGSYAGDLLVGNFGNGEILAFNATTNAFNGALKDALGNPISIDGLWALQVGNGGNGGLVSNIYFTAGLNGENDGLFGNIASAPEAGSIQFLMLGGMLAGGSLVARLRGRRAAKTA